MSESNGHSHGGVVVSNERLQYDGEESEPRGGFQIPGPDRYASDWNLDLDPGECPDPQPADFEVDAALWMGRFTRTRDGYSRLRESRRQRFLSRGAIEEYWTANIAAKAPRRMAESLSSIDWFGYGADVLPSLVTGSNALTQQYLPLLPGPVTRQLYWQDYFAMSAKAFEAYNHDPISWRGVQLISEFVLGRGVQARATKDSDGSRHDRAQAEWDDFWERNDMARRAPAIVRDLSIFGEQFLRYFPMPGNRRKLVIRSIDPASVYDLITDQEDFETVFAYHTQWQTPYQLYAPEGNRPKGGAAAPTGPTDSGATTKFIVRQVDASEIDHYRVNVSNIERRGRSDLFPVLGHIKRLRDYVTSRVVQADMQARYAFDLSVKGSATDVTAVRNAIFPNGQAPPPGSVLGHTEAASLTALQFSQTHGGSQGDPLYDSLVNLVAVGLGVPKEYLGISGRGTRATALVATEPSAKRFEDRQGLVEVMLHDMADRVFEAAGINDANIEFTFPSIASEDRTQKLTDLAYAEANGWLAKETSSSIAAKELGITGYEYDEEQKKIADEFPAVEMEDNPDGEPDPVTGKKPQRPKQGDGVIRRSVIVATQRQAAKLDVTKSPSMEDEPPGLLVPTDGSTPPGAPGAVGAAPAPQTRAGFPADENPASKAGAANIRKDDALKESVVTMTVPELAQLMRESRGSRRRPDDPDFLAAAEEYKRKSADNLGELVKEAATGLGPEALRTRESASAVAEGVARGLARGRVKKTILRDEETREIVGVEEEPVADAEE